MQKPITRRELLRLLALSGSSALLLACSKNSGPKLLSTPQTGSGRLPSTKLLTETPSLTETEALTETTLLTNTEVLSEAAVITTTNILKAIEINSLPPLTYSYNALEPYIDAQTLEIHYLEHHANDLTMLKKALEQYPDLAKKPLEELLGSLETLPKIIQNAVNNFGGSHANHALFWSIMQPNGGGEPTGSLAEGLKQTFGSFKVFQQMFTEAALNQFGSGWAWLVMDKAGNLSVLSLPNEDSPLVQALTPLLGLDVWEHAYYLKYQNKRADYIEAWWNVVNWAEVALLYKKASQ